MNIIPVNKVGQGTETTLLSTFVFVNTARYSGFELNSMEMPSAKDPHQALQVLVQESLVHQSIVQLRLEYHLQLI